MKKLGTILIAAALLLDILGIQKVYQWHQEDENDVSAKLLSVIIATPPSTSTMPT